MCGRFANATTADQLKSSFKISFPEGEGHNRRPRWNIPPGTDIETIMRDPSARDNGRTIAMARWGMEFDWSPRPLINARGESMFKKRSYSESARTRRCLVVATGWFEWKAPKQPYFMRNRDDSPMAMGGLFRQEGDAMRAVVVTCGASGALGGIHHRAPLLLEGEGMDLWLDPASPQPAVEALVVPTDGAGLEIYPVSPEVGSVSADHEGLIRPVDGHGPQTLLAP